MATTISFLRKKSKAKTPLDEDTQLSQDETKFAMEFLKVQQELRLIKSEISQQCRQNYELERDVRMYDSKIAHLINHRITLEEFEEDCGDEPKLGTIPESLQDAHQQQLFGGLFFLLQTKPMYLSKLTREVSMKEIDSLLQPVMFSLYGNQYEDREECLLLSMFEHAMMLEFQATRDQNSLMRANTAITRMMTTYTRRGPGMKYVKLVLGELIQEVAQLSTTMEINPLQMYQTMIEEEEVPEPTDSTQMAQLADSNPVVQKRVAKNLALLEQWALRIFCRLQETLEDVPYGIRWLCKAIRVLVKEKFPDASPEYCQSLIGGFFILRFINPVIVTPNVYHLMPNPPSSKARRNLTLIAKVIQKLGNIGNVRETCMKPLEGFVKAHSDEFKAFLSNLSDVDDFHETLLMEEYFALSRKDLFIEISPKEIQLIHSLLLKYIDNLTSSDEDLLHQVLQEVPPIPDEVAGSSSVIRINLVNKWLDTHVTVATGMSFVALEDSTDEVAVTRRHCRSLLVKLGSMAPHCLKESTLESVVSMALNSPMEEITMNAKLVEGYARKIKQLGGLEDSGKAIIREVQMVLPPPVELFQKSKAELASLVDVKQTLQSHWEYLKEQICAYQEYLQAVRAKVSEVHVSNCTAKKGKGGQYQYTHLQLEKDGVILETQGIPEHRRSNIYYVFSSGEPGIYIITMYYKGKSEPIYEKSMQLEDLLEVQHMQDPVIDMEGFVLLNVRRTLLLLNRLFIRGEVAQRSSIHRRISLSIASTSNAKS